MILCAHNIFSPLILQPTRVTAKSKTLIDNIFLNSFEFTIISGNIAHPIPFDSVCYSGRFYKASSPCKFNTYKRNFKNFDRNKLREDFYKTDWDKFIHENDNNVNDAFNIFYKTLTEILDHHAPLIKITIKELWSYNTKLIV